MAEKYGFFNDVDGDRAYYDDQLTLPFGAIVGSAGVVRNIGDELKPRIGTGMQVKIGAGLAFLGAMPGWWYQTTYEKTLNISAAQAGMKRVDAVVLRLDRNTAERNVSLAAVQGTEAADSPSAPTLTKDETVYELKLAEIEITAGTITGLIDARKYTEIGNSEVVSIKNITVDSGVVKGDFIYKDGTSWKIDNTDEQKLGTHIYDGKDAVCWGIMTWTSDGGDVDYSLYVQPDGKLGIGTTGIIAAKILSADKVFIDFKPVNQKPKAYTDDMVQFFAMPGPTGKVRLKIEVPDTADGAYIYRNTAAYAGEGRGNWGTLVANVIDDSDYSGDFEWLEDDDDGGMLTNGTTYHYKAFPYIGSLHNDTPGSNELYCRAGYLEHEWIPSDLSGGTIADRAGNNDITITNIILSAGGGKVADALTGSAGYAALASNIGFLNKSIFMWINVDAAQYSGLFGSTTNHYIRKGFITNAPSVVIESHETNRGIPITTGWHLVGEHWGAYGTAPTIKIFIDDTTPIDTSLSSNYAINYDINRLLYCIQYSHTARTFNADCDAIRIFTGYPTQNELDMMYNGGAGC